MSELFDRSFAHPAAVQVEAIVATAGAEGFALAAGRCRQFHAALRIAAIVTRRCLSKFAAGGRHNTTSTSPAAKALRSRLSTASITARENASRTVRSVNSSTGT
jgi:hypothetical protein